MSLVASQASVPLSVFAIVEGVRIEPSSNFNRSIGEMVKLGRGNMNSKAIVMAHDSTGPEPILEVSSWVLETMDEVSHFLGVSFEGVEKQAWELFIELGKRGSIRGLKRKGMRLKREVRNLRSGVNYDKGGQGRGGGGHRGGRY